MSDGDGGTRNVKKYESLSAVGVEKIAFSDADNVRWLPPGTVAEEVAAQWAAKTLRQATGTIRAKVAAGTILELLRERVLPPLLAETSVEGRDVAYHAARALFPLVNAARAIVEDRPAEARRILAETAAFEHTLPATVARLYEELRDATT